MFRMINPVQDYAWGSTTAFSELFGWTASPTPQAELWLGAHPRAPSQICQDTADPVRLDAHLRRHPEQLGTWQPLGTLPYLLKVLAVSVPLSIQVHPSEDQARSGFAAEDAAGIDLQAPQRNYVDTNHKPELLVALTEFSALCGFREPHQSAAELMEVKSVIAEQAHPASSSMVAAIGKLAQHLGDGDLQAALQAALEDFPAELSAAAKLLADTDLAAYRDRLDAQALDTVERITEAFPTDPGLFVALMLNRRDLQPGQALFLPSGHLHAYLGGVGVEVMANSDNVLRGGLTAKHIDVAELLHIAQPHMLEDPLVEADSRVPHHHVYRPAAEEFALRRIEFPSTGLTHQLKDLGPAIAVCTSGTISAGDMSLTAGESVFIPAGEIATFSGSECQLFIATAPGRPQPQETK